MTLCNDKGISKEEAITLINIYTPNTRAPKYIKQILTDITGEIDNNTIIVENFNTPLTSMDRSPRQKINKATMVFKNTIDQLDLTDVFSSAHGMFSRIDHMLGHNTSLNKFKKIEIISSINSDHNSIKLEINYRNKNRKTTNTWRLLNNQWVNDEIKEEIRN